MMEQSIKIPPKDLIDLGPVENFSVASRWTIQLSTARPLVLFRLPHVPRRSGSEDITDVNTNGKDDFFCMNQECPHAGGPMEDSALEYDMEDEVWTASCPWHSYDFNVETGESKFGIKTCTYPVIVREGHLWLRLTQTPQLATEIVSIDAVSEAFPLKEGTPSVPTTTNADQGCSKDAVAGSFTTDGELVGLSLAESCRRILMTPDPQAKVDLTRQLYGVMQEKENEFRMLEDSVREQLVGQATPPEKPLRTNVKVVQPHKMPKLGSGGTVKSRIALLHSLANIEQWAMDLALDICVRFSTFRTTNGEPLPGQFFLDWVKVANDEAKHFCLLRDRVEELGSYFGALPVHHGFWHSAAITSHDIRARISLIALVHEARGLDVNPRMVAKFKAAGDEESVRALEIIHKDEITHVTTGHRWLTWICEEEGTDTVAVFRRNVRQYWEGAIRGPFNVKDRSRAGLSEGYYEKLDGRPKTVLFAGG